jgi:hypothetical protein
MYGIYLWGMLYSRGGLQVYNVFGKEFVDHSGRASEHQVAAYHQAMDRVRRYGMNTNSFINSWWAGG